MHGSIQLDDLENALSHAEFARNCWHEPAGRFLSPFWLADNTRLITVRRITCRCNHAMRLKIPNNAQWYSVPSYPSLFSPLSRTNTPLFTNQCENVTRSAERRGFSLDGVCVAHASPVMSPSRMLHAMSSSRACYRQRIAENVGWRHSHSIRWDLDVF